MLKFRTQYTVYEHCAFPNTKTYPTTGIKPFQAALLALKEQLKLPTTDPFPPSTADIEQTIVDMGYKYEAKDNHIIIFDLDDNCILKVEW